MSNDDMSGFGVASDQQALHFVTRALRAADTAVIAAAADSSAGLVKALDGAEGVIGEWLAMAARGGYWLAATDTRALGAAGGGDLVVMTRAEDAAVLCVALGVPAPGPGVLARVVGTGVPRLLAAAMDLVDPPPSAN